MQPGTHCGSSEHSSSGGQAASLTLWPGAQEGQKQFPSGKRCLHFSLPIMVDLGRDLNKTAELTALIDGGAELQDQECGSPLPYILAEHKKEIKGA